MTKICSLPGSNPKLRSRYRPDRKEGAVALSLERHKARALGEAVNSESSVNAKQNIRELVNGAETGQEGYDFGLASIQSSGLNQQFIKGLEVDLTTEPPVSTTVKIQRHDLTFVSDE
jgi:hypothetical protein